MGSHEALRDVRPHRSPASPSQKSGTDGRSKRRSARPTRSIAAQPSRRPDASAPGRADCSARPRPLRQTPRRPWNPQSPPKTAASRPCRSAATAASPNRPSTRPRLSSSASSATPCACARSSSCETASGPSGIFRWRSDSTRAAPPSTSACCASTACSRAAARARASTTASRTRARSSCSRSPARSSPPTSRSPKSCWTSSARARRPSQLVGATNLARTGTLNRGPTLTLRPWDPRDGDPATPDHVLGITVARVLAQRADAPGALVALRRSTVRADRADRRRRPAPRPAELRPRARSPPGRPGLPRLADRGVRVPRADATRVAAPMSSSGMRVTSPTIASPGSQQPDARRLIAEYEDALTAALAETDQIRASQAFDRADRLQHRLLRLTRTRPT